MAETKGELFSVDFNSIGGGELLEVDVPQGTKTEKEVENEPEGDNTPKARKDKKDNNLIEVETEGDGEESVAPSFTSKKVVKKDRNEADTGEEPEGESRSSSSSEEQSPFTPFAKALHEEGILPNLEVEKFEGTADGLFEAVRNEITVGVETYKESLPPVIKEILDNYEEGVPLDKLIEAKSRQIEYASIKEEDLKDESLQKAVIRDLLKTKGMKDSKITNIIESFEDGGKLLDEAKDSLSELQEIHKEYLEDQKKAAEQRNKDVAKRNEETLTNIRNLVDKTEEIIPDLKLNKNVRDRIYNSMTMVTSTDERGNPLNKVMEIRRKDPMKFEMVLHYLADLGVFEGDWSKIKSKAKTSAVKELEEKISRNTGFSKGSTGTGFNKSSLIESLKSFNK